MVNKAYTLNWTTKSQKQMREAYEHISEDSIKSAQKVIGEITTAVEKAIDNPEFLPSR